MFYAIGTYSDSRSSILGEYATLNEAQGAIHWQGQPRGEITWHDKAKTRAETWYSGGCRPNEKTHWTICKASHMWGVFEPLGGGESILTNRGCYTQEAYKAICDRAYNAQTAF